jgi:hypothetical protein
VADLGEHRADGAAPVAIVGRMIPAETRWAARALRQSRDRVAETLGVLIEDEMWAFDPGEVFGSTAEALMWIVLLDDWYSRDHFAEYDKMKAEMKSLLRGLRWARNRTLHDFALLTGFVTRRWSDKDAIHPGWRHPQDVLPSVDPKHDEGVKQYDGRVAGRALVEPITEVAHWFEGRVEVELNPPAGF